MDPSTTAALQNAYALIKVGRQQDALAMLIPIVKQNPNNADVWYLMGFALTDPQKRLQAFQQVLRIDPSNQPAQNQIAKLRAAQSAPPVQPAPVREPVQAPPAQNLAQPAPKPVQVTAAQQQTAVYQPKSAPVVNKKPAKNRKLATWLMLGFGVFLIGTCFAGIAIWQWTRTTGLPATAILLPILGKPTLASTPGPTLTPLPSPIPSSTPEFTPVFRSGACPFEIPLGKRIKCGTVSVPQNREKNYTDLIKLPVVIYQSSKPDASVIIYLQGGPGVESIDWSVAMYDKFVVPILEDYDLVFFDPRGTGRSEPRLECPALNKIYLDTFYQNRSEDEAFKEFTAIWTKCHDRFITQGVDPSAFNTTQSAADVRDIAVALGYKQVNLLGISYGTRLGLTVMRDYPEIVRAAVLDSVVPMESKMFNRRASDVEYALKKVFADCAASSRCNSAYPDLENIFDQLIKRFDEKPVTVKAYNPRTGFVYDVKVNGVDMMSAIVAGLHTSELVPVVPKAIYDIQNGDYTFLSFALGVPGGEYSAIGLGTYFATVCPEQVYASSAEEIDADVNLSPLLQKFSLASLFGSGARVFELCQAWGAREHRSIDSEPVKADIPTLVLSGEYDPTTPVTTGQIVSDDLPNNYFYVIPGLGHGVSINPCALGIVKGFLNDPTQAPDTACLAPMQSFDFFLPYNGTQAVDIVAVHETGLQLKGVVPASWEKRLPSGFYFRRAYLFDPTQVGFISYPTTKEAILEALRTSFESSGFEQMPRKLTTHSANGFSWTIYQSKFNGEPVLIALTQVYERTIGIIMVVSAPERDAYYNGLFLPMIDALIPA